MYENIEMRQVFAGELEKIMEKDERVLCIDADLARANGTLGLRKKFPDRAFDVGVAEQNMASVAAGAGSHMDLSRLLARLLRLRQGEYATK